jgi:hypothetical protein
MGKAQKKIAGPAKEPVHRRISGAHRVKRTTPVWFSDPEVQAGLSEAEADFVDGRFYTTDSSQSAKKLLDSWK